MLLNVENIDLISELNYEVSGLKIPVTDAMGSSLLFGVLMPMACHAANNLLAFYRLLRFPSKFLSLKPKNSFILRPGSALFSLWQVELGLLGGSLREVVSHQFQSILGLPGDEESDFSRRV